MTKEIVNQVKDYINKNDRFAALCGMKLTHARQGEATAVMELQDQHKNSVGSAHGGLLFTLADFAFACACNTQGQISVSISASIYFHHAASQGKLTAKAREIARSRKLGTYEVTVTDAEGKPLATFTGLAYVKEESLVK